jgi:uncharacterized membrane protein SpoIIM required for sporulation
MREVLFLKKNREKWKAFEQKLARPDSTEADELAHLFMQVTDDLAYAQTFYPKSNTRKYLNRLAAQVYLHILLSKKQPIYQWIDFWVKTVPRVLVKHLPTLGVAALLFFTCGGIGVLSSIYEPTFMRQVLGDDYVNMTIDNITAGNPTGVYQSSDPFDMFIRIAFNNIKVELMAFSLGLLFTVGTAYILLTNGIMIGVFFYLFYAHNAHDTAWLNILVHGTVEILTIVISGTAGFVLGQGLLFPKTYSRMTAFRMGAKEGLTIILSVLPFTVLAAILESYVTRYANMPIALNLFIVIASLGIMVGYFIVYPLWLYSKTGEQGIEE